MVRGALLLTLVLLLAVLHGEVRGFSVHGPALASRKAGQSGTNNELRSHLGGSAALRTMECRRESSSRRGRGSSSVWAITTSSSSSSSSSSIRKGEQEGERHAGPLSSSAWPGLAAKGVAAAAAALMLTLAITFTGPLSASAAASSQGAKLFENNCSACHLGGGNVIGYARGKTLKLNALKKNGYAEVGKVTTLLDEGKGIMTPYGAYTNKKGETIPAKLSKKDMQEVSQYVLQRAEEGWN